MTCPTNYNDLVTGSSYCYRIENNQETWESARVKCQEDDGELACFSSQEERDDIANQCDDCWVGYTWQNSKKYKWIYDISKIITTKSFL